MCTINRSRGRPFGSDGCPVPVGNSICGETKTLDIINEFKRLYEEKMQEIDNTSCGDCLQEKIKLQQDWIGDLTEQNEMLVRAVEELEQEATERVKMLEEKLQRSAECICEVMKKYREHDIANSLLEEPRKRIFNLENDLKNLLEFLRRIRDERQFNMGGLTFYEINERDLLGDKTEEEILHRYIDSDITQAEKKSQEQNSTIHCLEEKIVDMKTLSKELNAKKEECECLQKNMVDMRQALTEEVATKHDTILKLKRECQELEDRCIQADKQTAFKDDIIKELRKEIKQLKQQENQFLTEDLFKLTEKTIKLENDIEMIKYQVELSLKHIELKMKESLQTSNSINHKHILNHLTNLNKSSVKSNLYSFMENEIIQLNKLVDIKHNQLEELFELIKVLIKKLFEVGVGLKYLEERAQSALVSCLENGKNSLEAKNSSLKKDKEEVEKGKRLLEEQLTETKCQIQNLENEFNKFLIEKQQLKEKYKTAAHEGLYIAEECRKLNADNCKLKEQTENLRVELEKCSTDKTALERQMEQLRRDVKRCCTCCTCKITQEEVEKLNKTVEELQTTLEETKRLREEEENEKCSEICALKEKLKQMECSLHDSNEKTERQNEEIMNLTNQLHESNSKIPCLVQSNEENQEVEALKEKIKELQACLCELKGKVKLCKYCKHSLRVGFCDNTEVQTDINEPDENALEKLIERDELIKFQADTLRMLQQELLSLQEREKDLLAEKDNSGKHSNDIWCLENEIILLKDKLIQSECRAGELDEALKNKEDIIKTQKETLNYIEKQFDCLKRGDTEMRIENEKNCLCIQQLKSRINELETTIQDTDKRASNLQIAVDLYTNTIKVLEDSEQKYKIEIEHQRTTITNLQEALVAVKSELDTIKQKYDDSVNNQQKLWTKFQRIQHENELEKNNLRKQFNQISDRYEKLQELNFNVEVEHCSSLQDVEVLDHQLFKYQSLLKNTEDELKQCKCHLKKLTKQKNSFEEIIQYFKREMIMMSEQLENLQALLTLSNDSTQEETNKLMSAFMNIQELNQKLTIQLAAAEQKVLLENQMNIINEAKISELEKMINEKEIDIGKHSRTINNIRESLAASLEQNVALQETISSLTDTICEFQQFVQKYEKDNIKSKEITVVCQNQIECCKEKLTELKDLLERKTGELCKIELAYNNQHRSLKCCQRELKDIKDRQKNKQYYLKCVIEELKDKCNKSEEERNQHLRELQELQETLCVIKRKGETKDAEITRYKKIIRDLKNTIMDLNKSLSKKEVSFHSKCNREKCIKYIEQFNKGTSSLSINKEEGDEEISRLDCPCEADFHQTVVATLKKAVMELKTRLFDTQKKNRDLEKELREKEFLVQEISRTQLEKDKEYNELKQKLMERLKESQSQEARYSERSRQFEKELGSLRRELELKTLQLNDLERNSQQTTGSKCLQLACAQEEINSLKEQLSKLLKQHCAINMENERLLAQSSKMQSTVTCLEEKSQLLRGKVEQYLSELQLVQKEKESLHMRNQDLLRELRTVQTSYDTVCGQQSDIPCQYSQIPFARNISGLRATQETCQSPWSLGSQGSSSVHGSPSRSPDPCVSETCDWYAANFRNESEDDTNDDEDWVSKVESLAAQVRKTNKMWKHKMEKADLTVSKDSK